MDKLEPIRAVFRQCGLYNHAADDLLCERLAEAMTPKTCAGDLDRAIAAAREALARLREHDGGTRYNGDDDDAGERACCLVASWKPHDSDCPHAVAVAEFYNLLAAIDAARGEAVAFLYTLEYGGSSVADRRVSTYRLNYPFGVCGADYQRSNEDGVSYVRETPLYAAHHAALAVPAGYVPVSALIEAREEVESWAAYATPYFQDKHDLAGVLAEIDAQIAAAKENNNG